MSIFVMGEKNTKICKENLCTSFVFGTMEFLDKKILLSEFLKRLDVSVSEEELNSPSEFRFWEKLDPKNRRTPDVIIKMEKNIIYIENKVDSEADSAQLIDEFEDAKDNNKYNKKNVFLIYITNDSVEPQGIRLDIEASLKLDANHVKWCNWKLIDDITSSLSKSHSLDLISKKLLSDLNKYLQVRILKNKPQSYGAIVAINPEIEPYRDDWLQNVIDGEETIYNSHHVKDLEFTNQKILFYRAKQGIIGEATIYDYYINEDYEGKHFHDFRDPVKGKSTFISYPKPVKLTDLKQKSGRPIRFRTTLGISKEMYRQIRELSGLKPV